MNGMEKIIARMKVDAARSLSELNAQTERELQRIREEGAQRAEKERTAADERAKLAAQERYERLCSAAEMETRKLTLSARQEVLEETYRRALDILCSVPHEEYIALLVRLLKTAGGRGDETIALNERDRSEIGAALVERANKELNARYTLSEKAADIRAGFVLVGADCDVNCSFETLLALSRERTERGAAKLLFAE